jgi:hypothetical protein
MIVEVETVTAMSLEAVVTQAVKKPCWLARPPLLLCAVYGEHWV